eukprot:PhM_4_TR11712/c1_g1_i1/m.29538
MIHAPLRALAESRPRAKATVLYPDAIRSAHSAKGLPFAGVNDMLLKGQVGLAPLHVRGDHWVLLSLSCARIRIYDSLTSHTAGEAKRFAQRMKDEVPRLKAARIEKIDSPKQADGSNDCGLWVVRNAYKYVLTKEGCAPDADFDYGTLFSREWLKKNLPSTAEAADNAEYIQELAVTIRRIAAERVGKQTAGDSKCASCGQGFGKTGKPAECTVCGGRWHLTCLASGARPRPGMDDWKCNPCAKSLATGSATLALKVSHASTTSSARLSTSSRSRCAVRRSRRGAVRSVFDARRSSAGSTGTRTSRTGGAHRAPRSNKRRW